MGNVQGIFDLAKENYNKAISHIHDMGKIMQQHKQDYSIDIAMCQFDRLLQSILLRVAISDNRLDSIEVEAIMKLTDHNDLLKWVNANSDTNFTWVSIYNMPESEVAKLLNLLHDAMTKQSIDLYVYLAFVDTITDFDYFNAFRNCINTICVALCHIDGDLQEETEFKAAATAIVQYFDSPYKFALNKLKTDQNAAAPNSLEANFEKMKKKQ